MRFGIYIGQANVKLYKFTPEDAKKLLETNYEGQRHLKQAKVSQFADLMSRGEWDPYRGDLIRIANGVLIDGQHRLSAQVRAGVDCVHLVYEDATVDDFKFIDTGTSRTAADSLGGIKSSNTIAAMLRLRVKAKKFGIYSPKVFSSSYIPANDEICDEYEEDVDLERIHRASKIRSAIGWSSVSAIAYFFWILEYAKDQQKVEMFEEECGSDYLTNRSFVMMRKYLQKMKGDRRGITTAKTFELFVRVWNAYYDDRELAKIVMTGNVPTIKGIDQQAIGGDTIKILR